LKKSAWTLLAVCVIVGAVAAWAVGQSLRNRTDAIDAALIDLDDYMNRIIEWGPGHHQIVHKRILGIRSAVDDVRGELYTCKRGVK